MALRDVAHPTSSESEAPFESPDTLETALKLPIPFPGSSVPGDCDEALRYSLRLETRYKADQARMNAAIRELDLADDTLLEALTCRRRVSRMALAIALGKVQMAREILT